MLSSALFFLCLSLHTYARLCSHAHAAGALCAPALSPSTVNVTDTVPVCSLHRSVRIHGLTKRTSQPSAAQRARQPGHRPLDPTARASSARPCRAACKMREDTSKREAAASKRGREREGGGEEEPPRGGASRDRRHRQTSTLPMVVSGRSIGGRGPTGTPMAGWGAERNKGEGVGQEVGGIPSDKQAASKQSTPPTLGEQQRAGRGAIGVQASGRHDGGSCACDRAAVTAAQHTQQQQALHARRGGCSGTTESRAAREDR